MCEIWHNMKNGSFFLLLFSLLSYFSKISSFFLFWYIFSVSSFLLDKWIAAYSRCQWKFILSHYINYFLIIFLVEELAATATDAFGNYLPVVLPLLLSSLSVPKGMSAATMMKNEHITPPLASLEQTLHCYNSLRGLKSSRRK